MTKGINHVLFSTPVASRVDFLVAKQTINPTLCVYYTNKYNKINRDCYSAASLTEKPHGALQRN